MKPDETAFCLGYGTGLEGKHWSAKEVLEHFDWFDDKQTDAFLNGQDDGLKRDSFRFDLIARSNLQAWLPKAVKKYRQDKLV